MLTTLKKIAFRLNAIVGYLHFGQWGVYLKPNTRVNGSRYIKLGRQFGAGDFFWIAAIDRYSNKTFAPSIIIGNAVSFSDFCHVASINKITIGNNVLIGSRVHITDHSHGNYTSTEDADPPSSIPIQRSLWSAGPVKIGNNVWIGDGVVILPNVTIGDGAVIGANSVVTRDVMTNTIVAGVPARAIKQYKKNTWIRPHD